MKKGYWYHDSEYSITHNIFYTENISDYRPSGNIWGPFKLFSQAKNDAIQYHKSTITDSRNAIYEIKKMKKGLIKNFNK